MLLGQERGNIEALLALKEQGCEVLCLIRNEEWITRIPEALESQGIAWRKVPFLSAWRHGSSLAELVRNAIIFIGANIMFLYLVRQFRPTHLHVFNQINVLTFIVALSLVRIPVVYRAGDKPTLHHWAWRTVWRFIRWRTSRFVAVSRFIADCLAGSGIERERIDIIYNRPPTRRLGSSSPPVLPETCDTWMIYVGQLIPEKGVDVAVEAFRRLARDYPRLGFLIVGRISEWDGDRWARGLQTKVMSCTEIADRVVFTGEVEDVGAMFRKARVHLVPSVWQEPSGNVVLEAKLAGVPSVVFPTGGLPEFIKDGVDGTVCSAASAEALADAIVPYLDDPGRAHREGEAARNSLDCLGNRNFGQDWLAALTRTDRAKG